MAITKVSPGLLDLDSGITISVADNSDNLILTSTDADASSGPNLNLYRNSSSPADNDEIGNIAFNGRNDNNQDVKYAEIEAYIRDTSDGTEDGLFNFNTIVGGSVSSRMKLDTSETIFNDDSKDLDFRVESNGNANMLFVDGGNDRVGIGTGSPDNNLHVSSSSSGVVAKITGPNAYNSESGISLAVDRAKISGVLEGSGGTPGAMLQFHTMPSGGSLTERLRIRSGGGLTFNGDTAEANALDDYEEGTFTPSLTFGGNAVSISYVTQIGKYTKIGNTVHCQIRIKLDDKGTSTGVAQIALPFAASLSSNEYPTAFISHHNGPTSQLYGLINASGTNAQRLDIGVFDGDASYTAATQTTIGDNIRLSISLTYKV